MSSYLKINWPEMYGFISGCSILFHRSTFIFMPVSHCFDYCSFILSFKIEKCASSNFVLFKDCLSIWGLLQFHMHFRISLFIYAKKAIVILISLPWICRLLWGNSAIFTAFWPLHFYIHFRISLFISTKLQTSIHLHCPQLS